MDSKIAAYFEEESRWEAESKALRRLALDAGLTEELKWGKPCYGFQGHNVAIIQAFKASCALMFFKGALLNDPKGILEKPGQSSQAARRICFTNVREIAELEPALRSYFREAIELEKSGREVGFKQNPEPLPHELLKRWAGNPKLKAAFQALTPGRQRGYILYFSAPKQSKTRDARIDKFTPQILAGRGLRDRDPSKGSSRQSAPKAVTVSRTGESVVLLSGGNPQIAKGDGDAPVQAYIAAMPGWKSDLGKRLDALIVRTVPHVRKAVKWNSPFYGLEGQGWFLSFHVLTKYVKVTFFKGMLLRPPPPGATERSGDARWIDLYEDDGLDEKQMAAWVKQAAAIPGWIP